jgi:nucleotide-binding universal stress UspA family protein
VLPIQEEKMPGIIVGIDGSSHSQIALDWAMREAKLRREPLSVLTVVHLSAAGWHGMVVFPSGEEVVAQAREAARETAAKAAAGLGEAAPSASVQAVVGQPAEVLIDASQDADLLVLGSRGTGGFARLTMGSVSNQVSQHAHCPVVIVRGDRHA